MGKQDDRAELAGRRAELEKILAGLSAARIRTQGSRIAMFVAARLAEAKQTRAREQVVATDRRLKFVRFASRRSLLAVRQALAAYDLQNDASRDVVGGQDDQDDPAATHAAAEKLMGDLARYFSVTADMPRTFRAVSAAEQRRQDAWAAQALAHYSRAGLPFVLYCGVVHKMLYATPPKMLLTLALVLRQYLRQARRGAAKPHHTQQVGRLAVVLDEAWAGPFMAAIARLTVETLEFASAGGANTDKTGNANNDAAEEAANTKFWANASNAASSAPPDAVIVCTAMACVTTLVYIARSPPRGQSPARSLSTLPALDSSQPATPASERLTARLRGMLRHPALRDTAQIAQDTPTSASRVLDPVWAPLQPRFIELVRSLAPAP